MRAARAVERPSRGRDRRSSGSASRSSPFSLNSPLETIAAHYLLVIHLLQNVMIADWAPPLLVLGLTPAMRGRGGAPRRQAARARHAAGGRAAVLAGCLVRGPPRRASTTGRCATGWPLNLEHALLIGAGLVFWWPVFSDEPQRVSTPVELAYLGIAFVGSAFLSLAYIFSARAFYAFYEHAPRLWGSLPTKDQNLGGILMNGEQLIVFFAALSYFLLRLLAEEDEAQRALEGP